MGNLLVMGQNLAGGLKETDSPREPVCGTVLAQHPYSKCAQEPALLPLIDSLKKVKEKREQTFCLIAVVRLTWLSALFE